MARSGEPCVSQRTHGPARLPRPGVARGAKRVSSATQGMGGDTAHGGRRPVYHYGDVAALEIVRAALALAPAPVRCAAFEDVAFLGVGRESVAWTGSSLRVDRHGRTLPREVVIGPDATLKTILHELAHVWFASPRSDSPMPAISAQDEATLIAMATREGWESSQGRGPRS